MKGSTLVPSKVLVPVDGSPPSLRALDSVIEMMGQHSDTSLVLLNVQNISVVDRPNLCPASRRALARRNWRVRRIDLIDCDQRLSAGDVPLGTTCWSRSGLTEIPPEKGAP